MTRDIMIDHAVQLGEEAFWAEVVKVFPHVKSGDFDFAAQDHMSTVLRAAVRHWLSLNEKKNSSDLGDSSTCSCKDHE